MKDLQQLIARFIGWQGCAGFGDRGRRRRCMAGAVMVGALVACGDAGDVGSAGGGDDKQVVTPSGDHQGGGTGGRRAGRIGFDGTTALGAQGVVTEIAGNLEAVGRQAAMGLGSVAEVGAGLVANEICDPNGFPSDNVMPNREGGGNQDWAAHKTYCIMTKDTGTGESVQGMMSTLKLFTCLLGEQLVFDDVTRRLSLPLREECLAVAVINELKGQGIGSLEVDITGSTTPSIQPQWWSHEVLMAIVPGSPLAADLPAGFHLQLLYRDRPDEEVAMVAFLGVGDGLADEVVAARMDYLSGTLYFEYRSPRYKAVTAWENAESWSRHMRLKVVGDFSGDLVLGEVASIESAFTEVATGEDKLGGGDDRITIATVRGEKETGFASGLQFVHGDPRDASVLAADGATTVTNCYLEAQGTGCAADSQLLMTTAQDMAFLLHPEDPAHVSAREFFGSSRAYLDFRRVDFAE